MKVTKEEWLNEPKTFSLDNVEIVETTREDYGGDEIWTFHKLYYSNNTYVKYGVCNHPEFYGKKYVATLEEGEY